MPALSNGTKYCCVQTPKYVSVLLLKTFQMLKSNLRFLVQSIDYNIFNLKNTQQLLASNTQPRKVCCEALCPRSNQDFSINCQSWAKPESDRINCCNSLNGKMLRTELQGLMCYWLIHVLSMDVEAYLVKTTIHHATLDMSWKDLQSVKKKTPPLFNTRSIYLNVQASVHPVLRSRLHI